MFSPIRSRTTAGYKALRRQFTPAALILSIAALVLALAGGAYAAGGGLSGKQKKEVEKIAKKYAGKPGAAGAAGTNGTNGSPGEKGAAGANGTNGTDGTNGKTVLSGPNPPSAGEGEAGDFYIETTHDKIYGPKGATWGSGTELKGANGSPGEGKSVESTSFEGNAEPPSEPCKKNGVHLGGVAFEVEGSNSPTYACNGAEGSPWTVGNKLPKGAAEQGFWGTAGTSVHLLNADTALPAGLMTSISFNIPIAAPLVNAEECGESGQPKCVVHVVPAPSATEKANEEFPADPEGCTGNVTEPGAAEGNLCIFAMEETNVGPIFPGSFKEPGFSGGDLQDTGLELAEGRGASGKEGAMLVILGSNPSAGTEMAVAGSWAVTAGAAG